MSHGASFYTKDKYPGCVALRLKRGKGLLLQSTVAQFLACGNELTLSRVTTSYRVLTLWLQTGAAQYMLSFLISLRIFYTLLATSVLATGVLLISYQRERQNLLLRSCCLIVLAMYGIIIAGHIHHGGRADERDSFCESQAIFLNYCYICIHAHACLMMFNNCYVAMGWKWKIFENHVDRESTLVLLSFALPLLSVALISFMNMNNKGLILVHPGPFFCNIVRPRFLLSTIWFMLFSLPGSALSGMHPELYIYLYFFLVYLLYKTWRARQRTLAYGNSTQLTLTYLTRLTLSTFVYVCLSYGTFVPLLLLVNYDPEPLPYQFLPPPDTRSPWLNPSMCCIDSPEIGIRYYSRMLCPGAISFFPAFIGISFFLMYGFGAHARAAYKHFAGKYFCQSKRRNSTLPLMESVPGLSTHRRITTERLEVEQRALSTSTASITSPVTLGDIEDDDPRDGNQSI